LFALFLSLNAMETKDPTFHSPNIWTTTYYSLNNNFSVRFHFLWLEVTIWNPARCLNFFCSTFVELLPEELLLQHLSFFSKFKGLFVLVFISCWTFASNKPKVFPSNGPQELESSELLVILQALFSTF
jgi:hypothetical protein